VEEKSNRVEDKDAHFFFRRLDRSTVSVLDIRLESESRTRPNVALDVLSMICTVKCGLSE
jgi:hypothetical protein